MGTAHAGREPLEKTTDDSAATTRDAAPRRSPRPPPAAARPPAVALPAPLEAVLADRSAGTRIQRAARTTGLPDQVRRGVESLSGLSMDGVRVHHDSARPAALDAHAYTSGTDIHVAPGQERQLAHEAWHVVQQAQGRVAAHGAAVGRARLNEDRHLERDADAMASRVLRAPPATTGGALAPISVAGAAIQLVRQVIPPAQPPVTIQVIEQAIAAVREQEADLGPEIDLGYWNDDKVVLDAGLLEIDRLMITVRRDALPGATFTVDQLKRPPDELTRQVLGVVTALGNLRKLLNAKHAEFSRDEQLRAETEQYTFKETTEQKAKNSSEARDEKKQEQLRQEQERLRADKAANAGRRVRGLGARWGKHRADLVRKNQLYFDQHVPAGAETIQKCLASGNILDAVYHHDKAFWVADPSKFELGSAAGKSKMRYTLNAQGAKSLMEDFLLCGSGDYADDNQEPWVGETQHPYFTIWKTNEIGAYGIGSARLAELAASVKSITAFDPEGHEIEPKT